MSKLDTIAKVVDIADTVIKAGIAIVEARRKAREEEEKKRKADAKKASAKAAGE
jgi:hypothetical protein